MGCVPRLLLDSIQRKGENFFTFQYMLLVEFYCTSTSISSKYVDRKIILQRLRKESLQLVRSPNHRICVSRLSVTMSCTCNKLEVYTVVPSLCIRSFIRG